VHEQRRGRRIEHLEQRREAIETLGGGEHVGGDLEPDGTSIERVAKRPGIGFLHAGHRPDSERALECERPLEPGVGQRGGLVRRQPVEAERCGRRQARALVPGRGQRGGAPCRIVSGRVDRMGALARQVQLPALESRGRAACAQRCAERRRPEVLMDIDLHVKRFTEAIH
jgi:hypothetical protein